MKNVLILGGGFGGLYAARTLAGAPLHVTLVDRRNYHLFQPLLYQVAGALSEIARQTMIRDFRHIDPAKARVILVEGRDRVLPPYPPSLSNKAQRQLERLGVEVITHGMVTSLNENEVCIGDQTIATKTVLWAVGVQASPLAHSLDVPLDRAGRVVVEPDLTIPGHPEVFVIGDLAAVKQASGELVPGVAPAAIQEGVYAAKTIEQSLAGKPHAPFRYRDKGSLATIGRAAAVADFGFLNLTVVLAWIAWLTVHIFFLIGFRNRLLVITQWAWAYLTYQRGARLITGTSTAAGASPDSVAGTTASTPRS